MKNHLKSVFGIETDINQTIDISRFLFCFQIGTEPNCNVPTPTWMVRDRWAWAHKVSFRALGKQYELWWASMSWAFVANGLVSQVLCTNLVVSPHRWSNKLLYSTESTTHLHSRHRHDPDQFFQSSNFQHKSNLSNDFTFHFSIFWYEHPNEMIQTKSPHYPNRLTKNEARSSPSSPRKPSHPLQTQKPLFLLLLQSHLPR